LREKEGGHKILKNSAPFWPFLGKSGQNSAADLSGGTYFYTALLYYAAELLASWQHYESATYCAQTCRVTEIRELSVNHFFFWKD
jgi:hypothetical protein